ncbi:MAG: alpha/beta hydrolase [Gammaproteobacteria bacterium]
MNALLMSVRFSHCYLIGRLDYVSRHSKKTANETKHFHELRSSQGDNAFCLTMQLEHDKEFFKYLLDYPFMDLESNCSYGRTPFQIVATYGTLDELEAFSEKICEDDKECLKEHICHQRESDKLTVLHDISQHGASDDTLAFLFEHGAKDCWTLTGSNLKDPYQIARDNHQKNITDFYETNILGIGDTVYYEVTYLNPENLLGLLGLFLLPALVYWLWKKLQPSHNEKQEERTANNSTETEDLKKELEHKKNEATFDNKSSVEILLSLIGESIGPKEYTGELTEALLEETKNDRYIETFRQHAQNFYPRIVTDEEYKQEHISNHPFHTYVEGGSFENALFEPCKDSDTLLFYIAGTAFSLKNITVAKTITANLAKTFDCRAIFINQRSIPEIFWPSPIEDVCTTIYEQCNEHKPEKVILTGYSAGGLFATLAALILPSYGINIDNLILFFPALDLSGEKRILDERERYTLSNFAPNDLSLLQESIADLDDETLANKIRNISLDDEGWQKKHLQKMKWKN